jgi:hypothetical protein
MAAVELQDPARDIVQKIAVVGYADDCSGIAFQKLLEPLHRQCVEMVGRFVQEQHVGFREEQPAERHAAPFTA